MDFITAAYASSAATEKETSGGIAQFGINGWSLAFQLANFLIVLLILHRWVLRPLTQRIAQRETTIAKSLTNAAKIEQRLLTIEHERETRINEGKKEAQRILHDAREQATQELQAAKKRLQMELKHTLEKTRRDLEQERAVMLQRFQHDAADLVITATQRLLHDAVNDTTTDRKIVEKYLRDIPSPRT